MSHSVQLITSGTFQDDVASWSKLYERLAYSATSQFSQGSLAEHMSNTFNALCFELASHSYQLTEYLCHCLLFSKGYLVTDTIVCLLSPQSLCVMPSIGIHQCSVNATPLQLQALVPEFQEPLNQRQVGIIHRAHEAECLDQIRRLSLINLRTSYTSDCKMF